MVRTGSDRRETGTHYTPKPLTEAIVTETLEPLVYVGPADGKPREDWKLKTPAELLDLKICDPAMGSGAFLVQVCRWLSERLVEAWQAAEAQGKAITAEGDVFDALGANEPLRPDPAERLFAAKRLIAERCLYGVDMNPLAVELAKLSIWLVTLAKGRPFGFLDHNFRSGDSLLGLQSLDQLKYLELRPSHSSSKRLFASNIDKAIEDALALRSTLRTRPIRDIRDIAAMADLNEEASKRLTLPHAIADALFAQVLKAEGRAIDVVDLSVEAGEAVNGAPTALEALRRRALDKASASTPFHWPLSFPEVFASARGGFDGFVGNPPFLGGQRISGVLGAPYKEYLAHRLTLGDPATADLVVFFFLRAFRLLSPHGHLGFLARRNFSEGKNREIGLEQIINAGATVHAAHTNIPWPGKAAVVVHQVHITKRTWIGPLSLDCKLVDRIDSHLGDVALPTPRALPENTGKMFQGIILNNEVFKLRDNEAQSLLEKDASNADVVLPFIGGNEINSFPDQRPAYWVVNFWDWPLDKAQRYDAPYAIIDSRSTKKSGNWWRPLRPRPDLHHAIGRGYHFMRHPRGWQGDVRRYARVLAISRRVTKYCAFTFLDNTFLFSDQLYVLADDRYSVFSLLSSDIHAIWAWYRKTSMGADLHSLSYTNGEIFETFPFPDGLMVSGDAELERLGEEFFQLRQSLMQELGIGITGVYNAFHDQPLADERLLELRRRQIEINRTVLERYGWEDIQTGEAFHEVAYLPAGSNVRFTVSEPARLEILKRLAMLNRDRSESQEDEPDLTEPEQEEPLEEGLFAPREVRRGAGSG